MIQLKLPMIRRDIYKHETFIFFLNKYNIFVVISIFYILNFMKYRNALYASWEP